MGQRSRSGNQWSQILQMLREERIPLEEAERLFDLVARHVSTDDDASDSPGYDATHPLGFDLGVVAGRLRSGFAEIEAAVREAFQAADLYGAMERALSYARASAEGKVTQELWGDERSIYVENPWGDVVLRGVPNLRELRISYRVVALASQYREAEHTAQLTRIGVERAGTGIVIVADPPGEISRRRLKIDLSMEVPAHFEARVKSSCGDFTAAELEGGVSFSGGIGDVVLQGLLGPVDATTALGDMSAYVLPGVCASLSVRENPAELLIEVPAAELERRNGSLHTTLFEGAGNERLRLSLYTDTGNIRVTGV